MSAEQWRDLIRQLDNSVNKGSEKDEIVSAETERVDSLRDERLIMSHL